MSRYSRGNIWIIVAICYSTKFVEAGEAPGEVGCDGGGFSVSGGLYAIWSDGGTEIRNEVASVLTKKLGVDQRFTRPYNPKASGCCDLLFD